MQLKIEDLGEQINLDILAKQLVEGFITGLHKSPYHGFSVEFAEHRLYNSGESTKHIDWKVFARTDRLYTKQYEEETNLRCHIIIDRSPSMYYPEGDLKIKFSILAAAALCQMLQKQKDAFGLFTFSDELEISSQIKSTRTHLKNTLVQLQQTWSAEKRSRKSSIAETLHLIAEKVHKRSMVVLFSDMFDSEEDSSELFNALQHLKHRKQEILLFHVTDPKTELEFEFQERPYEFIDIESGEKLKLNPSEVKDHYKAEMSTFYKDLKLKCAAFKIDFIEADVNKGVDQILNAYLIKRAKMR